MSDIRNIRFIDYFIILLVVNESVELSDNIPPSAFPFMFEHDVIFQLALHDEFFALDPFNSFSLI